MQVHKLSVSLPDSLFNFVEEYQMQFARKSRSEVIAEALILLRQSHLVQCYADANLEIDPLYELITADGLDPNETW